MSAIEIATAITAELDHFHNHFVPQGGPAIYPTQQALLLEPFVGYAVIARQDGQEETFFICRHYTPHLFSPGDPNALYGSYLSNHVGQLMAQPPGQQYAFDPTFTLIRKCEFRPSRVDGRWDGVANRMAWMQVLTVVPSLRSLLAGDVEKIGPRAPQIKVQLPDQAILDTVQDQIFRLPFNQRVRLSGAPGTGKTTVLLKRLSQKTKREFLTDEERALLRNSDWADGQNWMLFTPSDLLKAYLKEALNKELLPAGDDHVKVYGTFKLECLREIGFIRVGAQGYFKVGGNDTQLLKRETGSVHVQLTQKFGEYLRGRWAKSCHDALQRFNNETRSPLGKLNDANQKLLLQALDLITQASAEDRSDAIRRAGGYRELNQEIGKMVTVFREVAGLLDQTDDISLHAIYDLNRRLSDKLAVLNTENLEVALHPEIPPLVDSLRGEVRELLEAMGLRRLFELVPRAYQDYREQGTVQERYFIPDAHQHISQRVISGPEQDLLLFHALEFVRALHDLLPRDLSGVPGGIRQILGRMRMIVAIDEVTDFSSLEIACMERLAMPRVGGVTVSGDIMQRVTRQGLKNWDEMDGLSAGFASFDLNVSYRQTERLFCVAKGLYESVTGESAAFSSAYQRREEDPPPVAVKTGRDLEVDEWLAYRIEEICELHISHLPTTAVLVPTGADVEELRGKLHNRLEASGIQVDGSHDGNNLGNASRVRVFPVDCIKGLEFEAVFYVGIDRMADIHKELIDKYLYVGLSRARSFLGVTYERVFPQRLQCIEKFFANQRSFSGRAIDEPVQTMSHE